MCVAVTTVHHVHCYQDNDFRSWELKTMRFKLEFKHKFVIPILASFLHHSVHCGLWLCPCVFMHYILYCILSLLCCKHHIQIIQYNANGAILFTMHNKMYRGIKFSIEAINKTNEDNGVVSVSPLLHRLCTQQR